MASVDTVSSAAVSSNSGRGNRRDGFRGGQQNHDQIGRAKNSGRGGRRSGGNSGRSRNQGNRQTSNTQDSEQVMRTLRTDMVIQNQSKKTALDSDTDKGLNEDEDGTEAEVCFICASDIVHQSIAPCNHRTCHICSLRMRALYKSRLCPHCRMEANIVIFTDDGEKRFEDFVSSDFVHTDDNLGIKYEKKEIEDDTILLLRYNCPDETCDVACFSWPDLHRHVRSVHQKQMCDLCTRNKKVFTHEHELYTKEELRRHEKYGDQKEDQTGFKGHPECGFCRQRFYGDDELYVHCRDKHEKCHLCERTNPQRQHQYYVNYDALEQHFRKDHFLCPDQECLDKKFVVFGSEMDLKAHQLEQHPNGLTKDARKDARRVDMANFDYRQPMDDRTERRRAGRSGGRGGGGRGRDPNADPIPPSSAQPMRRDEIAYQRQMAIQSAQSVATRTFGGQLTSGEAYAAAPENQNAIPETVNIPRTASAPTEMPAVQGISLNEVQSPAHLTPQEQARQIQHNAVIQRASHMLDNDIAKLRIFRERVSSYRTGVLTASQMVDALLALFDAPAVDLGKLIKELADLYENEQKRNGLLKAWNDWRAINEDYPTLPGPSGSSPSSALASTSRRILKLKSSTVQSQRAPATQSRTWGIVATAGNGDRSSTPAIAVPKNRHVAGQPGSVSWAGSSKLPSTQVPRATARIQTAPSSDAFPSLPTAAKPNTYIAGMHRGTVDWLDRNPPPANAWIGGSTDASNNGKRTPGAEGPYADNADEASISGGKKRGRKGKQTTLYHFG